MWWLAVVIPLMVVAVVVAVVPVALGSVRFHRWHTRQLPRRPVDVGAASGNRTRRTSRVRCPLCAAQLEGETVNTAIAMRNDHFLRTHVSSETPSSELEQGPARSA